SFPPTGPGPSRRRVPTAPPTYLHLRQEEAGYSRQPGEAPTSSRPPFLRRILPEAVGAKSPFTSSSAEVVALLRQFPRFSAEEVGKGVCMGSSVSRAVGMSESGDFRT